MQYLTFEHLTTEVECDEKVLITVEMNTSNRDESFELVKDLVKQAVENVNSRNHSNHGNYSNHSNRNYSEHREVEEEESGFLEEL